MDNIMELKNISHSYNNLKVLEQISLTIPEEKIVCFLGPSGSGKTTLFKIAARLINPDRGEVFLKPEKRIGYIFQEPRLLPWKTVENNLKLVQNNYLAADKAQKIRKSLLDLTGLSDCIHNYPGQLSGGMKQRIEIIKALSINPDFLLMDEPFKSIDTQTRINFQKMLLRFQEQQALSMFIITHDPEEAVMLADEIYVLSQKPGKIIKKFILEEPQPERTLKAENIFNVFQQIIDIFQDLVDEFRWERDTETFQILKEITGGKDRG
ncbi:MAG: ABC transporter ATP-binding protein [Bacillota bacterium]